MIMIDAKKKKDYKVFTGYSKNKDILINITRREMGVTFNTPAYNICF